MQLEARIVTYSSGRFTPLDVAWIRVIPETGTPWRFRIPARSWMRGSGRSYERSLGQVAAWHQERGLTPPAAALIETAVVGAYMMRPDWYRLGR